MGGTDWFELFYWAAFLFGLGYAVVGAVGHGFGAADHDLGGHDVDTGHDVGHGTETGGHASPLNSLTIAAFSTGLGALGLLGVRIGGFNSAISLLFALAGGLAIAALFFFAIYRPLVRMQTNSTPDVEELLNAAAVVRVTIPAGGFGEVVLSAGGARFPMPARSEEGREIADGQRVAVMRISKGIAYVVPLDEEELGFKIDGELT